MELPNNQQKRPKIMCDMRYGRDSRGGQADMNQEDLNQPPETISESIVDRMAVVIVCATCLATAALLIGGCVAGVCAIAKMI
jgi:hypothetical protein